MKLGWTSKYKLTINNELVRTVAWYDGFVSCSTDRGNYQVDSAVFERFVGEHWDPSKTWYYTSSR